MPPSIPAPTDNGYDLRADGALVAQPPPPHLMPSHAPGPQSYEPRLDVRAPRRASFIGYGRDRSIRIDVTRLRGVDVPGPGAYELTVGLASSSGSEASGAPARPRVILPTSSFASTARRGVETFMPRPPTGSRVGPGSHWTNEGTTSFRPKSASKAPILHFNTTAAKLAPPPDNGVPGPGAYERLPTGGETAVMAASMQAAHHIRLAAVRLANAQALPVNPFRPRTAGSTRRSVSPHAVPPPAGVPASADSGHAGAPVPPSLPVPVFFSSAPRFDSKAAVSSAAVPGVGSYFSGAAPPPSRFGRSANNTVAVAIGGGMYHYHAGPASTTHSSPLDGGFITPAAPFDSKAPRFASTRAHAPATGTGVSGLGPGTYEHEPAPSLHTALARARPSPAFLAVGRDPGADAKSRAALLAARGGAEDAEGGGASEAFLKYDIGGTIGSKGRATSAQRGRYMALEPPRPSSVGAISRGGASVPGPGDYELAAPIVDAAEVKVAARLVALSRQGKRPLTAETAGADAPLPAALAIAADARPSSFLASATYRFVPLAGTPAASALGVPGPGTYDVDDTVTAGRTKRTYNVTLAAGA